MGLNPLYLDLPAALTTFVAWCGEHIRGDKRARRNFFSTTCSAPSAMPG